MSILNECQEDVHHGTGLFYQQNIGNDGSKNIYIFDLMKSTRWEKKSLHWQGDLFSLIN